MRHVDVYLTCVTVLHLGSTWSFPRGKLDANEQDWECAIREVHEETGVDVQDTLDRTSYIDAVNQEKQVCMWGGNAR